MGRRASEQAVAVVLLEKVKLLLISIDFEAALVRLFGCHNRQRFDTEVHTNDGR